MKLLILSVMTLVSASASAEELFAYKLTVKRDGKQQERVAYPGWSGEYPGPVIDIQSKKPGKTTTVHGYESLRVLGAKKACTVKNGIYHPWSTTQNSIINMYSIIGVQDYQATANVDTKDHADIGATIKKGDQILNVYYQAEGYCGGILKSGTQQTNIGFDCGFVDSGEHAFEMIKNVDAESEQWIYLKCAEGYNVFAEDGDLLSQPKVKQGEITGYGEVSGAK